MLLTRNALGNLLSRYRAVLGRCRMLNVLGSLALAAALALGGAGAAAAGELGGKTIAVGETVELSGDNSVAGGKTFTVNGTLNLPAGATLSNGGEILVKGEPGSGGALMNIATGAQLLGLFDIARLIASGDIAQGNNNDSEGTIFINDSVTLNTGWLSKTAADNKIAILGGGELRARNLTLTGTTLELASSGDIGVDGGTLTLDANGLTFTAGTLSLHGANAVLAGGDLTLDGGELQFGPGQPTSASGRIEANVIANANDGGVDVQSGA